MLLILTILLGCNQAPPTQNNTWVSPTTFETADTATLPCEEVDLDGDGVSACDDCNDSDWTVSPNAQEICDGKDNDCNGVADDGTCDDGNGCTIDTCAGADGCTYELLTEGECLDGDACTIGDHCEEGVCVGKDIDCDDENPCTCLLYTSPSPRDRTRSRMPSSA